MYKVAAQVKTQHCEPVYSKSFYFLRRASLGLGSNFHTYLGLKFLIRVTGPSYSVYLDKV